MTTVRKIIVDSRYFIEGTAGQGTFELSEIVDIHPSQVLYLESFQCVNSWYTIDETNRNIYLIENPSGSTYKGRITQIKIAPYDSDSFASAFQDAKYQQDGHRELYGDKVHVELVRHGHRLRGLPVLHRDSEWRRPVLSPELGSSPRSDVSGEVAQAPRSSLRHQRDSILERPRRIPGRTGPRYDQDLRIRRFAI